VSGYCSPYPEIDALLAEVMAQLSTTLAQRLVGLYLFGSLVWGDFDLDVSDVDLLAAIASELDERELAALELMHTELAARYPRWEGRVEVIYAPIEGLRGFRERNVPIAKISPGEPLHAFEADELWLVNWHLVREHGVTLFGPPPAALIAPTTEAEFLACVRAHARAWPAWVDEATGQKSQSYAVLSICRAFYTLTYGRQPSKHQAAEWAVAQLPEWAWLIDEALAVRAAPDEAPDRARELLPITRQFVRLLSDRIGALPNEDATRGVICAIARYTQ
jgi:Domain of unknown function (DUF4111)